MTGIPQKIVVLTLLTGGCQYSAEPEVPSGACSPPASPESSAWQLADADEFDILPGEKDYRSIKRVSWDDDILPFLEMRGSGRKFVCTTCHHDYRDRATIEIDGEIDRILTSLRASGAGFMPRIGDRVPDNYLLMLKTYRDQGKQDSDFTDIDQDRSSNSRDSDSPPPAHGSTEPERCRK